MRPLWMIERIACALAIFALLALETTPIEAATTLNPNNPSSFTKEGNENQIPGADLTLEDHASSDFVAFYATDSDDSGKPARPLPGRSGSPRETTATRTP